MNKDAEVARKLRQRLKVAIGGLRSIAYGVPHTWPNANPREVAKQALKDCSGEKGSENKT
jgi:hypothetical protein